MVRELPICIPPAPDRPEGVGSEHPMRAVTREVAFEPAGWTPERAVKVGKLFDALAPEWHTRMTDARLEPVRDALERGAPSGRLCVEVGSGTGFATRVLAGHFEQVMAMDLAREMLQRAPADLAPRLQADGSRMPIADGGVDCVALVNALLFPTEVARVLRADGTLIWVNTQGDRTPIHLSADEVERALPGRWNGCASEAGWGTWCVLRRTSV